MFKTYRLHQKNFSFCNHRLAIFRLCVRMNSSSIAFLATSDCIILQNQIPEFFRNLIVSPYKHSKPMQIAEILRAIKSQTFTILEGRKCSEIVFCNMLQTYYVVSKQFDILHSCSLIKILQILLVLITISILSSTGYKYISLGLLIICFSLIAMLSPSFNSNSI